MDKKKYIQTVTEQIRCKRALPLVTKELEGHIEDQKSDYMKAGMNAEEAEEAAVLEMGDPVEVGVEMDRIHRPKMAWKMIGLIAILNLAGIVLMYLIRTSILADAGNNPGDVEWIASGIGGNINYLKSVMWTIIGLACMIGICYFDYSRIGKYGKLLTGGWIGYGTEPVHGCSIYQWSCLRDPVFIWPGITAASIFISDCSCICGNIV